MPQSNHHNRNGGFSILRRWLLISIVFLLWIGVALIIWFYFPQLADSILIPPTATQLLPTSTPYSSVPFEVFAAKGWQDTGVFVNSGDQVEIIYVKGLWTEKKGINYYTGPAGGKSSQDNPCNPMSHKETGYNALIGKIWYGKPFLVGQYFTGKALISGTLYLRMNDCDQWLADNDGSVHLLIQISR